MAEKKPTKKPDKKSEKKTTAKKPAATPKSEPKKKETKAKAAPAVKTTVAPKEEKAPSTEKTTSSELAVAEEKPATEKKVVEAKVEAKTEAKPNERKKSKKGLIFGLISLGVLAIVGIVLAVVFLGKGTDGSDPKANISYSDSFFISDDGKYTLWNADGERVNQEEYDYISDFIGGYAYVKKDDKVGVIRDNGNMSVEFGKYGSITAKGGLFLAQDGNTKKYHLITGDGRELLQGDTIEVKTHSSTSGFAIAKTDGKLYVFNHDGKKVLEEEATDDEDSGKTGYSHDFGLVYYKDKTTVFDARTGNVMATLEGRYTFDEVHEDRTKILLQNYDDSKKHTIVADGKQYELEDMKYYSILATGKLIGYDNYEELALINDEYKVEKKTGPNLAYKDCKNYAEAKDGKVEIYRNGELIKTIESADLASGVMYEDYYAIKQDDKYKFYHLDGSVASDHEYAEAKLFNKHHHATVADEEGKQYLVNNKFERLADNVYSKIYAYEGGYEVYDEKGKYAILDKKGELATDMKYEDTYYRSAAVDGDIWTAKNGYSDHDVYNIETHTLLLEHANVQSFYAHYFTVRNSDKKTEYRTYTGKLFYTSK